MGLPLSGRSREDGRGDACPAGMAGDSGVWPSAGIRGRTFAGLTPASLGIRLPASADGRVEEGRHRPRPPGRVPGRTAQRPHRRGGRPLGPHRPAGHSDGRRHATRLIPVPGTALHPPGSTPTLSGLPLDELRGHRSRSVESGDFGTFWSRTPGEAREHDLDVRLEPVTTGPPTVRVHDVTFSGFGGHRIEGSPVPANKRCPQRGAAVSGVQPGLVRNRRRYSVGVVSSLRRKALTRVSTVPNPHAVAMRSSVASVDSSWLRALSTRTDSM